MELSRGSQQRWLQESSGSQDEHEVDAAAVLDLDMPSGRLQPEEDVSLAAFALGAEEPLARRHRVGRRGERDAASGRVVDMGDGQAVPPPPSEGRCDRRAFDPCEHHRERHVTVVVRGRDHGGEDVEGGVGRCGVVPVKPVDPGHDSLVPSGELGPEQRDDLLINERENGALKLIKPLSAEAPGHLAPPG
jgi:hypothetical protein